ncbi:uncharacterized protein LOC113564553 isoform X1 [Drosophila erecta]|uniref:uncharacterized protein LOC113564553 isoform X1 n=1 Tax=Drosophila erecta TaxID=7220 RepID=UPI000F059F67|nr:uncharacterized protein LOC113564553 isoform X1 [Drosophila erecta]
MARAKLNQWVVQLRDVGKVLRCNLPIMDKANWVLSRIQSIRKPLPLTSSKCPPNATEPSNSKANISGRSHGSEYHN